MDPCLANRNDLIFGSEIGAWDMDGGTAIHNPTARQNVMAAGITVIRWGTWKKFDNMDEGQAESMTVSQFNQAIDGIRSLGALPFIKLPPVWDQQGPDGPDNWSLEWMKEIVRQAGNRVQLYEAGNETDHYCGWWDGAVYADYWIRTVPHLKKLARSLGFEIFIGGPAKANSYPENLKQVQDYLTCVKEAWTATSDPDYLPDFVSTHAYMRPQENANAQRMQQRIDAWGSFYLELRAMIDRVFSGLRKPDGEPVAHGIKIACSEYNYTIDNSDTRNLDPDYIGPYQRAMFAMFRESGVWMANQFTIASHKGGALDLLYPNGTPKPHYKAFKSVSAPATSG